MKQHRTKKKQESTCTSNILQRRTILTSLSMRVTQSHLVIQN